MPVRPLLAVALAAALAACAPTREVYDVTSVDRPPDVASDSLAGERARARIAYADDPSPTPDVAPDRRVDLLHTALDLRLDLPRRAVVGTATHRLAPLRDSLDAFALHAVGMDVERVRVLDPAGLDVAFDYDSTRLLLTPSRPLTRADTLTVEIAYTAYPMRGETGDLFAGRGMYFIDPDGTDPYRPTQVWTQGQTEDNRRWFPTWDYPSDKMTFEIAVTVPDSLRTFSNGTLLASEPVAGGLRRDAWRLDGPPMAAYLAAVVAGRFAVVEDAYARADGSRVPLLYAVEPRFEEEARRIFGETPRMMAVFEEYLGVRYPWPDYKQVTVRDFTAGGMENTTLTVMHEGLQTDPAGALSDGGEARDLISHELAHQWLGNLTTTEDWANIAVNEGFATFMEALYREAAFGRDAAQDRRLRDWQAYRAEAARRRRPIVWYGYGADEGLLFDTHTYHKAGRVLHQLRFELGDAAFRRGLTRFLTEHAGRSVELADLRQAMEAESGRSLVRFFDQWFRRAGHPSLDVEQAFFPGSDLYTVQVTQTQDPAREPVFAFDVLVELNYPDGTRETHREHVATADTTLRYRVPQRPAWVRFDAGDNVPAEVTLSAPPDELVAMAAQDEELAARFDAVAALGALPPAPQAREALVAAARGDAAPVVRMRAVAALEAYLRSHGVPQALADLATADPDAEVREAALLRLAALPADVPGGAEAVEPALRAALADSAYRVVGRAALTYARLLPRRAYDAYAAAGLLDRATWGGAVERPLVVALDSLRDVRGLDYLAARSGPDNPDGVREAAARALARLGMLHPRREADLRAAYVALLDDRLADVRRAAAQGLLRTGTPAELSAIDARIAVEPDAEVRTLLEGAARRIRAGRQGTEIGPPGPYDARRTN